MRRAPVVDDCKRRTRSVRLVLASTSAQATLSTAERENAGSVQFVLRAVSHVRTRLGPRGVLPTCGVLHGRGLEATFPPSEMVDLAPSDVGVAAGTRAFAVASDHRPAVHPGEHPFGAAQIQQHPVGVDHDPRYVVLTHRYGEVADRDRCPVLEDGRQIPHRDRLRRRRPITGVRAGAVEVEAVDAGAGADGVGVRESEPERGPRRPFALTFGSGGQLRLLRQQQRDLRGPCAPGWCPATTRCWSRSCSTRRRRRGRARIQPLRQPDQLLLPLR